MSLMQALTLIRELQRSVDQQLAQITDFQKSNRDNISLVTKELYGSRLGHDAKITSHLSRVEHSLTRSASSLRQASQALARIQVV